MIRKTIKGGDFKSQMVGELVFDQVPEEGSFNPVTSDAVVKAIDEAKEDMQEKIDDVTLDPSAVALGNVHLLDEVTEFPADGCILIDSETNGPGEMPKDTLLELTAQNALAGNVAPAFDPTRDEDHKYLVGESVTYEGKTYTFKVDHYGAWNAADVKLVDDILGKVISLQKKAEVTPDFITGKNLVNKAKFSELGEWCNYTDGVIESTAYTTNYRHTPYIKVSASTNYARRSISNAQYGAGRMAGIVFFDSDKNFISGTQLAVFTTPSNCSYIIENIDVRIETAEQAVLIESETAYPESSPNLPYYNDFKYPNPEYLTKEYINDNIVSPLLFVTSENLLNQATMSELGEWCNYTDGVIESNAYTTNYRHSQFIKVEPSTSYARRSILNPSYGAGRMAGYAFFDANKNFISGGQSNTFTTPANCAYIIENIDVRIESVDQAVLIKSGTAYPEDGKNLPYYNDFKYPNPAYTERDYVTVGASDADFTSVGEAFSFARANDKWVLIKPGVYDLVAEGISGEGYILPKKVVGYGAKLVCDLPEEDWDLSPLNTKPSAGNSFEVYGLEIECSKCRYCIHDDMGSSTNRTPYHNIFKDLILTHKSPISEVLLQPLNIGGGFGDGGYIEIVNCKMTATMSTNFTYHSNPFNQQASCVIQCHHNYLNKRAYLGSSGTPAEGVTNTFYVSDCVFGTYKPQSGVDGALVTKAWNNVVESNLQ